MNLNKQQIYRICKSYADKVESVVLEDTIRHEVSADERFNFFYFHSEHKHEGDNLFPSMWIRYHMLVKGAYGIEQYYYDSNVIDKDKAKDIGEVKIKFKNYLTHLLNKLDY